MRSAYLSVLKAAGVALIMSASAASAAFAQQQILGRVFDNATNQPVEDVTVQLLAPSGRELNRVLRTNKHGVFIMPVDQGRYRLSFRRIGFKPVESDIIDVQPKTNLQINYALTAVSVRLAKIEVKPKSGLERGREGMAKREPLGKGVFLYEKDFREIASQPVYEILGHVPGLRTWADGSVRSLEGNNCLQFMVNRQLVTEVPDIKLTWDMQFASLYQMLPNGIDIAGIEVYRKFSEVPKELQLDAWQVSPTDHGVTPVPYSGTARKMDSMPACGLVNIWTRGAW
jgi:hypothetical protein